MIRWEIHGQEEVLNKIAAINDRKTRAAVLDDFGSYMLSEVHSRFENESDPEGEPWQQSYRAREEGGQTLSNSNILRQSMTYVHSANRLELGSALIYARIHQDGGEIRPKNAGKLAFSIGGQTIMTDLVVMPARPYLGFTDQDSEEL